MVFLSLRGNRKETTSPPRKPAHFGDIHNYPSIPYIPRSSTDEQYTPRREDLFARAPEVQAPSIYEKFSRRVSTQPRTSTESWTRRAISNGLFDGGSQSTLTLKDTAPSPKASRQALRPDPEPQPPVPSRPSARPSSEIRPVSFVITPADRPTVPSKPGHRIPTIPSRNSSLDDISLSTSPRLRSASLLSDYSDTSSAQAPARRPSTMRPSPLNPNAPFTPDDGYETGASALNTGAKPYSRRKQHSRPQDILEETAERAEEDDTLHDLRGTVGPGVLASFANIGARNYSTTSVGSKAKADKVLGLDPNAKLASFYLVSGVPRVSEASGFSDALGTLRMVICRP